MKHKLESRAGRNSNNLKYADDTTLMAESEEELKSLLMKVKERVKKLAYNSTVKKLRSWHQFPSFHHNRMVKIGTSDRFYFLGL